MAKQQLYINGVAVDMPQDTIKIKVESNVLNDADKTMTAHSYNIALPRTIHNDSIFKNAYIVGANTGGVTTHAYLSCALYFDGVPLFEDGTAVLNIVDEKGYNINLFWGLIDIFDEIKREGLQLCDLPMSSHWNEGTMANWVTLTKYYDSGLVGVEIYDGNMNDTIYSNLDTDSKALADKKPWTMPYRTAEAIMNKIAEVYGLTFDYSAAFQTRMQLLAHPLTTLKTMCKDEVLTFGVTTKYVVHTNDYNRKTLTLSQTQNPSSANILADAVYWETDSESYHRYLHAKHKINIKKIKVTNAYCDKPWAVGVPYAKLNENAIQGVYNSQTGYYEIADYEWHNVVVPEGGRALEVGNVGEHSYWTSSETPVFNITVSVEIDDIGDIDVGDYWCYERNLPEIKVIDYISEILAHTGAFIVGSVTKPAAIRIVTLDEVAAVAPVSYVSQGVEQISMTLDDLAQRNKYVHKENDDNEALSAYTAEGVIYSNDETLKLEREAFKSDFKVPRENLVKLWKVEKQENNPKDRASWNNAGDYIMGLGVEITDIGQLLNTGQDFASVIANYYGTFEQLCNRPKVVEIVTRLTVLQLLAFNFEAPVYVPQLACAFLVVSIENDENENYKLNLIRL